MSIWLGLAIFAFGFAGGVYRLTIWDWILDGVAWVWGKF